MMHEEQQQNTITQANKQADESDMSGIGLEDLEGLDQALMDDNIDI